MVNQSPMQNKKCTGQDCTAQRALCIVAVCTPVSAMHTSLILSGKMVTR